MRVLCISPYYEPAYAYGGPARSIPSLCQAMTREGTDVTVFTTNANGAQTLNVPTGRPLFVKGVRIVYFRRLIKQYFAAPALARACSREVSEFDIVHVNGIDSFPSLVTADAAFARSVPFVISPRGTLMPWALGYKRFKKTLYMRIVGHRRINRAGALICTDAYEMEALQALGFKNPMYIIPNGLNTRYFADLPPRGELRRSLQIPEKTTVILILGRLHPVKRPDLAVEAFGQIADLYPLAHLIFAGPDEVGLRPGLLDTARQAGCASRVHFTGLLKPAQVLQALADADLLLMTSESENFGMAVAEAMAAGLPIVVSNKIGISRFVRQANAGEVVSLDAKSIADGLERLLKYPGKLGEIGLRARQIAVNTFDLAVVARQMITCYAEVLKERKV